MRLLSIVIGSLLFAAPAFAQKSDWQAAQLPFRPVGVATNGSTFWAYGSDDGIASSVDGGLTWKRAPVDHSSGALLLGLEFPSANFGFAFGSGGSMLFTVDGGGTWAAKTLGKATILLASFSDPMHGIVRTASSVEEVEGDALHPISFPEDVPKDFKFVPAVVALSPAHMSFAVSEGWRSRTGLVSTTDAGKTWTFYEPPHIVAYDLLRANGLYQLVGTETVGYDKNGEGGLGVPAVLHSVDGHSWTHTSADIHPCHWEGCDACTISGCLASGTLMIRPFTTAAAVNRIPKEHLTAKWAATADRICSVDAGSLYCASLAPAGDIDKNLGRTPDEPALPALREHAGTGLLQCIICGLRPIFVDKKANGPYTVHAALSVRSDGTMESVTLADAPTSEIGDQMRSQMLGWLFEVPLLDGKPVRVTSKTALHIMVIQPR